MRHCFSAAAFWQGPSLMTKQATAIGWMIGVKSLVTVGEQSSVNVLPAWNFPRVGRRSRFWAALMSSVVAIRDRVVRGIALLDATCSRIVRRIGLLSAACSRIVRGIGLLSAARSRIVRRIALLSASCGRIVRGLALLSATCGRVVRWSASSFAPAQHGKRDSNREAQSSHAGHFGILLAAD
jgi:hypothetical protein